MELQIPLSMSIREREWVEEESQVVDVMIASGRGQSSYLDESHRNWKILKYVADHGLNAAP